MQFGHLRRREFLSVLAGATAAVPLAARAQPATPMVGFVSGDKPGPREEAFRQGLRDLGYVEGQSIAIEWRFAEGQMDRVAGLIDDLVRLPVAVIVTDGTRATGAARNATQTIPIVMASDSNPVGDGHVASLARPGGNITGLANINPDLGGKRLEVLKEALPGISRVAVIWNPEIRVSVEAFRDTEKTARLLGVELLALEARRPGDLEGAMRTAADRRADAITVLSDAIMFAHRERILALAAEYRLPSMHAQSLWVKAGGLLSYGTHFPDLWRRAAGYVHKILKGAKPGDLPIEQPTKFELVVNLKTAKALGIEIPPTLLARADEVIE
jgi:putative tryptophan/tyrosine transport system substrate-binding protein